MARGIAPSVTSPNKQSEFYGVRNLLWKDCTVSIAIHSQWKRSATLHRSILSDTLCILRQSFAVDHGGLWNRSIPQWPIVLAEPSAEAFPMSWTSATDALLVVWLLPYWDAEESCRTALSTPTTLSEVITISRLTPARITRRNEPNPAVCRQITIRRVGGDCQNCCK
jgi:hypothetical protein